MELKEAISGRMSVRAFKAECPPRDLVMDILLEGQKAPSGSNIQPWEFVIVTGTRLDKLRDHIMTLHHRDAAGYPSSGSMDNPVPDHIWQRQKVLGRSIRQITESIGEDHLSFIVEGSLSFYGAPMVVLVLMDRALREDCLIDIGLAVGNVLLSAHSRGLGACPIGMANAYGDRIIKFLDLEERKRLVLAVALGYADSEAPINRFKSRRAPADEVIRWLD